MTAPDTPISDGLNAAPASSASLRLHFHNGERLGPGKIELLEHLARERSISGAARAMGITPVSVPSRGGTDGSRLTELGVPCPNLFTGMQEIHGPLEWISVQDMAVATNLMLGIVQKAATP